MEVASSPFLEEMWSLKCKQLFNKVTNSLSHSIYGAVPWETDRPTCSDAQGISRVFCNGPAMLISLPSLEEPSAGLLS
jgi:hypothetical protein